MMNFLYSIPNFQISSFKIIFKKNPYILKIKICKYSYYLEKFLGKIQI